MPKLSDIVTGDLLVVEWPTDTASCDEFEVEVLKIKSKGDKLVFTLLFVDQSVDRESQIVRKTNLIDKVWKFKSKKARKRKNEGLEVIGDESILGTKSVKADKSSICRDNSSRNVVYNPILKKSYTLPDYRFIVAPMVGGSELAFRLLCRKYGATLAYTPMINSNKFANDDTYRKEQFQTIPSDRPLVAHFAANNPSEILTSARFVESECDAIDINLGCPQRVAHAGHFGSFLLDPADRPLIMEIVRTLSTNLSIPCFVKIRLLDSVPDTIQLCEQLIESGAALVAIHARYRVSLVGRTGPGARDGPAHLDQVKEIKAHIAQKYPHVPIIANGNVKDWNDVEENLKFTGADGIMSAEGLLDNPALFGPAQSIINEEKISLALEYLDFVDLLTVPMKSVVFHIRRICKDVLTKYQMIEEVIAANEPQTIRELLHRAKEYEKDSSLFVFDQAKDKALKDAIERRKQNESKRKEYEARMIRKAKREGKDLGHYLKIGADLPSVEELNKLKTLSKDESFAIWKDKYSQNCYAYHFEAGKCPRERACCFLHADASYSDAVAYG